jgi:peptidyl-prolyl cis-trans isomerase-like protein 2
MTGATVFTNPYKEMAEEEDRLAVEAEEAEAKASRQRTEAMNPGRWFSDPAGMAQREDEKNGVVGAGGFVGAVGAGVGKYMTAAAMVRKMAPAAAAAAAGAEFDDEGAAPAPVAKKAKPAGAGGFGNFSAW